MKRSVSLAYKVVLAFLIVLLPIAVTFIFTLSSITRSTESLVFHDLRSLAEARAGDLQLFFELVKSRALDFSSDGVIRDGLEAAAALGVSSSPELSLYLVQNKLPILEHMRGLSLLRTDGVAVASTDEADAGGDFSSEDFFSKGLEALSLSVRRAGPETGPELAVSVPVYGSDGGSVVGVLAGFIPYGRLGDVFMRTGLAEVSPERMGTAPEYRTLDIYLVNMDMLMITPSLLVGNGVLSQRVDTPAALSCLRENRDYTGLYEGYRGEEVLGSSICIPSLGWALLVELDRAEALAPVRHVRVYAAAAMLITVALISAFIVYIFRTIIRQLKGLAASSNEIAAGNYNVRIPVNTSDEIGTLAESFNRMAGEVKERSQALTESEERFRAIMDNTTNVVYLKDLEGRYLFINRRYEELFHVNDGEIRGKTDRDFFPKEAADAFRANDLKALASESPLEFEEAVPQEDGPHVYISVKFRLRGANGVPYAAAGISTDITDIRRSQEVLSRSEASLANAQRIARLGDWDWDIAGNGLHWSDETYRIFGVTHGEFVATYDSFLGRVHPDDRGLVVKSVDDALYNRKPYSIDHRILLPDGAEKVVHEDGEVAYGEAGRPVRMTGTVQDITERKRAEEEIRELNLELEERVAVRTAELEAANRDLEAFSYSVAHDLKSPLRVIDGFARILLKDYSGRLDDAGQEHLTRLCAASSRMGQLIDALLKLSNIMRAGMSRERVYLSGMARAVAAELRKAQPGRKAEFVIEENLSAEGDPALLRIMMDNLLGNAWKFTEKKDIARIEFGSAGKEDGRTVFFVRDNGAGFDMKYAERLFKPFQRLHDKGEYPGTGIGLATVQRIVERHGGRIRAEARKEMGAAFYFTI